MMKKGASDVEIATIKEKSKKIRFVEDKYQKTQQRYQPQRHEQSDVPNKTAQLLNEFNRENIPIFPQQHLPYFQWFDDLLDDENENTIFDKETFEKQHDMLQNRIIAAQAVLNIHKKQRKAERSLALNILVDCDREELSELKLKLAKLKYEYHMIMSVRAQFIEFDQQPVTSVPTTLHSESAKDAQATENNKPVKRKRMI